MKRKIKNIWRIRKDSDGVSPVIATILMVAITVVLAAVLYVMVMEFDNDTSIAPTGNWVELEKDSSTTAIMKFGAFSKDIKWTDITIKIAGVNSTSYELSFDANPPTATDVDQDGSGQVITAISTDLGDNSQINTGDYITLTWANAQPGEYTITIVNAEGEQIQMSGGSLLNM